MLKKIIFIISICICFFSTNAQTTTVEETDSSNTVPYDDATLDQAVEKADENSVGLSDDVLGDTLVHFNDFEMPKDSIINWKAQKKYAWSRNIDSLLKDKQIKNQKNFNSAAENTSNGLSMLDRFFSSPFLKVLLWLIAFSLVAFVLYKLFLSKGIFRFATKKQTKETPEEAVDNINESDFEKLFQKAYAAGDLRMGMRYLFLRVLQKLNEKDLIYFTVDKTNGNYLKELPLAKRNDFASLALYYEYIWYGNVVVEKETFSTIEIKVNEFINKL
jgi:hypothetical protein